jgi:hypothetical protein
VYSTDEHETTRPDWPLLLGVQASQEILAF